MADAAVFCLTMLLTLLGVGCLCAAGFVVLQRYVGLEWALTIFGLIFLILAGFLRLIRPIRPAPAPVPTPDPLTQLVFDLGVGLGRALFRRRD